MSVNWNGPKVLKTAEAAVERGLDVLANKVVKHAQKSMRDPKTGKQYTGMPTRSSAPYEAPAAQRGGAGLQGRIHMKKIGKLARLVGTDLEYGLYLEVGTKNMAERPWLRPAMYKHTGRTGEEIFRELMP